MVVEPAQEADNLTRELEGLGARSPPAPTCTA